MKQQRQTGISAFKSTDGFIYRCQKLIKDTVIPYQYDILCDRVAGAEKSHVVANFINAGKALRGEDVGDGFYGMVFQDSDAAKWIEAVAYSLVSFPDKELEAQADELIGYIAAAQDEDGYLNTYYTIKDREKRWKNLLEGHELYCAGHMMEAAAAYYTATGKDTLLKVMLRNAEHIYDRFVTMGQAGYPGHPEVELALLRLYSVTGNRHCLELAKHFIDVRGVDSGYFSDEIAARDWTVWGVKHVDNDYQQSGAPVREQSDATGHSVRAVYLYTAMAELAAETDDEELLAACGRLWESITKRRMYITGGIGSTVHGEAFTVDYDLPSDTAYAETCASIGLIFFASRMLECSPRGEYADVMERAFYNTVLAGMQLDGKRFFYVNPLEVVPGISGKAATHRHVLTERPGWYACACCPPNAARLISSFGRYAYGENDKTAFCHMFAQGSVSFANGMEIVCKTEYPYGFEVRLEIVKGGKTLAVHIPECGCRRIAVNGHDADAELRDGYAYLTGLRAGDIVELRLDDSVRRVFASAKIPKLTGCAALMRGPLVYCFEGVDNGGDVLSLSLAEKGGVSVCADGGNNGLPDGIVRLEAEGFRMVENGGGLYTCERPERAAAKLTAVPYYTWGNRGETQMRVWMNCR